jgi:hypothetical protein
MTRGFASKGWALIIAALVFPQVSPTFLAVCLIATLLISAIRRERIPTLALAAVIVACVCLLFEATPALSLWSAGWLMFLQDVAGIPVLLAPGIFSSRGLIVFALYGLLARDWPGMRLGVALNLLISVAGLIALGIVAPRFSLHYRDAAVGAVLIWGVLLAGNWFAAEKALRSPSARERFSPPLLIGGCAVASAVLAGFLAPSFGGKAGSSAINAPIVAIFMPQSADSKHDFGVSDGHFGLTNIGLYGDMREFLTRLGYKVLALDSLTEVSQRNVICLFCPTFSRSLSDAEITAVRSFLESGGRLVVVAEHTNLDSNADFINALIKPYGLAVNFDNTNGLLGEGLTGTLSGDCDLAEAVRASPYLTHNRGASIHLTDFHASPVLVGRFWQADRGDSLRPEHGFLSDGRLSAGDRLGNIVLMATAPAGKGRVFLSGDSSPFLNQNLAYNARFLVGLFSIMTGRARQAPSILIPLITAIITVLALGIIWVMPVLKQVFGRAMLAFLVLCLSGAAVVDWHERKRPFSTGDADWMIISTKENNAFDRDPFSMSSTTGLALQIFRARGLPVLTDWGQTTPTPRILFIINPTNIPDGTYLRDLSVLVEGGTHAIIAGDGDNSPFDRIASHFGFGITAEPVGSLTGGEITTYTAWRVDRIPSGAESIAVGSILVGGTAPLGSGRVTVIADGGFFLSKNLETETTFDEANCRFVRSLVSESQP